MWKRNGRWLRVLLCGVVLAAGWVRTAHATIVLKPNGQNSLPLRAKALDANVEINGRVAQTEMTLTFANETSDRIEADFFYSLPPGATATTFAYWYGNEKVEAKVVERERAATIYHYITSRQRDPALVEMVGKNLFRARIFPIEPNADLRIQMRMVQTLQGDVNHAIYAFPLQTEPGFRATLDSLKVHIHVRPDAALQGVSNNLGVLAQRDASGYSLTLARQNARATADWRVVMSRAKRNGGGTQTADIAVAGARDGGSDGFFAMTVVPTKTIRRPKLSLRGVQCYATLPAHLPTLQANQPFTLVGRYRGAGTAQVTLHGVGGETVTRAVAFSGAREAENAPSRMWAASMLDDLNVRGDKVKAKAMALSYRFGLPCKWTSWLAIPQAERNNYHEEMREAELANVGREVALRVAQGQGHSREAQQLRAKQRTMARQMDVDPQGELNTAFSSTLGMLRTALAEARFEEHPNARRISDLKRQVTRLARVAGKDNGNAPIYIVEEDMRVAGRLMAQEIAAGREHGPRARMLKSRLAELERVNGYGWKDSMVQEGLGQQERNLRLDYLAEASQPHPNARRMAQLDAQYRRVSHALGNDQALTKPEVREAQQQLQQAEQANDGTQRDQAMDKLRLALNPPPVQWQAQGGDPLISVEARHDAQQVVAIMPGGDVKTLVYDAKSGHWEGRFDIPMWSPEGDYPVTVVIVLKNGTRKLIRLRYRVDITAPGGQGGARIVAGGGNNMGQRMLRLELQADPDTTRVTALLPDGDNSAATGNRVNLAPSARGGGAFFALVPLRDGERVSRVTYVLLDRAHNRSTITVDVSDLLPRSTSPVATSSDAAVTQSATGPQNAEQGAPTAAASVSGVSLTETP